MFNSAPPSLFNPPITTILGFSFPTHATAVPAMGIGRLSISVHVVDVKSRAKILLRDYILSTCPFLLILLPPKANK